MRGRVDSQTDVFHTFNVEDLIPANHPLRPIKGWAGTILKRMSRDFSKAYGKTGRPSIPPERLIKALLLRALYSIRSVRRRLHSAGFGAPRDSSEIPLCEQINYNMLFRWFLDLQPSQKADDNRRGHNQHADN